VCREAPRRLSLDNDCAQCAGAAGDRDATVVSRSLHPKDGPPCLLGGNRHQRNDNVDLLFDVASQSLCRKHGVLDRRQIDPHSAPAIFRIPNVSHVAPLAGVVRSIARVEFFAALFPIISDLPHCSNTIVRRNHSNVRQGAATGRRSGTNSMIDLQ
jgi:hypothetical protein